MKQAALLLLIPIAAWTAAPVCVSGANVASLNLSVQQAGGEALPLREVDLIPEGARILYQPAAKRAAASKDARLALVLIPLGAPGHPVILEPRPADRTAEWKAPLSSAAAAVVYGPNGLTAKRVSTLVAKDRELVHQLADYAEKTQRTEALIEALATHGGAGKDSDSLEAALRGFAGAYGIPASRLDRNAPAEQQALVLLKALNPALSSYDPLTAGTGTRMRQSAGLAAAVATLFFGTPVGVASGGAALFLNLRGVFFPDTEFRTALAAGTAGRDVDLCGKREDAKSRTRVAYLWGVRLPNAGVPKLAFPEPAHLPLGVAASIAAAAPDEQWPWLARARDWRLVPTGGGDAVAANVRPLAEARSLRFDLSGTAAAPGEYRLRGRWDWQEFEAEGAVHLHSLPDLSAARLTPASAGGLIAGSRRCEIVLTDADFRFLEKLEWRAADRFAAAVEVPFSRRGNEISATVDATGLAPGVYLLLLTQQGGAQRELPVRLLPPHPKLDNLPLRANLGESRQRLPLAGTGLDRIERLEAGGAALELVREDGRVAVVVDLPPGARRGERIDLLMKVEGVPEPVPVAGAIEVAGPRPRIVEVHPSAPEDLPVALHPGELPAGSFTSFALRVEQADPRSWLRLECTDRTLALRPEILRAGEQKPFAMLRTAGHGSLFLSLDAGALAQPGCELAAVLENEEEGASDPKPLGRVVRLPRIESFELTNEQVREGVFAGRITGQDLEMIERTGWNAWDGEPVTALPTPVAGEGRRHVLKVALPWPSPKPRSPLYIWLRGESEGRLTRVVE